MSIRGKKPKNLKSETADRDAIITKTKSIKLSNINFGIYEYKIDKLKEYAKKRSDLLLFD